TPTQTGAGSGGMSTDSAVRCRTLGHVFVSVRSGTVRDESSVLARSTVAGFPATCLAPVGQMSAGDRHHPPSTKSAVLSGVVLGRSPITEPHLLRPCGVHDLDRHEA